MTIEITNLPEFEEELQEYFNKKLWIFGQLIVNEIQDLIEEIPLFVNGDFWRSIHSYVDGEGLHIDDGVFYGIYLEYGTYAYWDMFGEENFNKLLHPKKSQMSKQFSKMFPKGMQPFAPFRRILFNDALMGELLQKAINS